MTRPLHRATPAAGETTTREATTPADRADAPRRGGHLRLVQGDKIDRGRILVGDALHHLKRLPDGSIDQVLTSPPYFRLRDYGHNRQLGLEAHVNDWVEELLAVADEVWRVLVPTGTFWLNLGDTYATHVSQGAERKSLLMAPERLALRLLQSGWLLRSKIVWAKTNPMPSNARDRLSCTYEVVYVLASQPDYFFDLDAIRMPHTTHAPRPYRMKPPRDDAWRGPNGDTTSGLDKLKAAGLVGHPLGKNPGDVWSLATANYRGDHHAVFPVALASRMVQAGCPEARCTVCLLPWRRRVIRALGGTARRAALGPTCDCEAPSEPGLVCDPFIGSGTTAIAAEQLSREWLGIELNARFAAQARERIAAERERRHRQADGGADA